MQLIFYLSHPGESLVLVVLISQDTRVGLPKAVMPGMALALRHRGHVFSPAAARHHSNLSFPNPGLHTS